MNLATRNQKAEVLHPFAFDSSGRLVNCCDAQTGESYLCLCCKNAMVVRKGKVRQPHFAHKQEGLCAEPDDVLHKTVQFLTVQAINDAVSCEQEYCLGYPCPDCKRDRSRDISPEVVEVKTERTVVKGTRSDIVVYRAGKPPVIIEVVVNHDLEPTTRDLYEDSGIPVFLIHPDWDNLNEFKQRVITTRTLNVDTGPCPGCVKKAENRAVGGRPQAGSSLEGTGEARRKKVCLV